MELQYWIWIAVGLSFTLYITIAIASRASSTGEFYIAGKGVPPIANGMATAADWMSAASFISMAGIISFNGYDGSVYLMGWTGGYVLLALLLAPYLRKFGKFTVPDFIGDRYYSNVARGVAVFCALIVSFTYIAGQMRGVGVVFFALFRGGYYYWCTYRNVNSSFLCSIGWNERYYLYTSSSVLCADFCLYVASYFYFFDDYWQCNSSNWLWIDGE